MICLEQIIEEPPVTQKLSPKVKTPALFTDNLVPDPIEAEPLKTIIP